MIETDVTHMQREGHDDQPNVHVAMRRLVAGLIDLIVLSLIQIWLGVTFGIVRPTSVSYWKSKRGIQRAGQSHLI